MKKAMLFVIALLFSVSASAASLTLIGDVGNAGTVGTSSGQFVTASLENMTAGQVVADYYTVTTDALTGGYLSVTFNPYVNAVVKLGTTIIPFNSYTPGPTNTGYFWVLAAATTYDIYIDIASAVAGGGYDLRVETPIPAALFLFAPALFGFLGLRRKSATAVAA